MLSTVRTVIIDEIHAVAPGRRVLHSAVVVAVTTATAKLDG